MDFLSEHTAPCFVLLHGAMHHLHLHLQQSFCHCIRGIVPAVIEVVLNQSLSEDITGAEGAGAFKQAHFLKQLKSLCQQGSWGYSLVHSIIQGVGEQ